MYMSTYGRIPFEELEKLPNLNISYDGIEIPNFNLNDIKEKFFNNNPEENIIHVFINERIIDDKDIDKYYEILNDNIKINHLDREKIRVVSYCVNGNTNNIFERIITEPLFIKKLETYKLKKKYSDIYIIDNFGNIHQMNKKKYINFARNGGYNDGLFYPSPGNVDSLFIYYDSLCEQKINQFGPDKFCQLHYLNVGINIKDISYLNIEKFFDYPNCIHTINPVHINYRSPQQQRLSNDFIDKIKKINIIELDKMIELIETFKVEDRMLKTETYKNLKLEYIQLNQKIDKLELLLEDQKIENQKEMAKMLKTQEDNNTKHAELVNKLLDRIVELSDKN